MAIKSADQISIVDVTDAYSVILTSETHTFPGTTNTARAGSTTTQVIALRGAEQISASVNLANIVKPAGVTVTKDSNTTSPTLTITITTSVTSDGIVEIPVSIEGGVTITKYFTFAIAFIGATGSQGSTGPQGPTGPQGSTGPQGNVGPAGADAITMTITSSAGTIFKNSAITTTLTAHVFRGGTELTTAQIAAVGTIKWYKDGGAASVATGQALDISAGDVTNKATYTAQLEG